MEKYHSVQVKTAVEQHEPSDNLEHFIRELCWREFSYALLFHFPSLPQKNFQEKFDNFAWEDDEYTLRQWQQGLTGYRNC